MSLIIFAIVVLIVAALVVAAISRAPLADPFNWLIPILVLLLAAGLIAHRAGLI